MFLSNKIIKNKKLNYPHINHVHGFKTIILKPLKPCAHGFKTMVYGFKTMCKANIFFADNSCYLLLFC